MNVLIVGCGREGSELARSISQQGHSVTIVDNTPSNFDRLGPEFLGRTVQGVSFDKGTLGARASHWRTPWRQPPKATMKTSWLLESPVMSTKCRASSPAFITPGGGKSMSAWGSKP
ncbi:MAG: NAD-binding protein [Anaerolineales bacterium]|nr:NAD-binding protein [Anaerolineales bacterium]